MNQPVLTFDAALPISAQASRIASLIRDHQVVVVAGETGSGKTTQLPKICLHRWCPRLWILAVSSAPQMKR